MKNKESKTGMFDEVTMAITEGLNVCMRLLIKYISKGLEYLLSEIIPKTNKNITRKTRIFNIKSKYKDEKDY